MILLCWQMNSKPLYAGGFNYTAKLDFFTSGVGFAAIFIFAIIFVVIYPNTSLAEADRTSLGEEQKHAVHMALEGEWICNIGNAKVRLRLPVPWEPDLQKVDWNEHRQQEETQDWLEHIRVIMRDNLANLSDMEQSVIGMRFPIGQKTCKYDTLRKIGDILGLSKERIRQIQKNALAKLRQTAEQCVLTE